MNNQATTPFFETRLIDGKYPMHAAESSNAYLNATIADTSDIDVLTNRLGLNEQVINLLRSYGVNELAVFTTRYVLDNGLKGFCKALEAVITLVEMDVEPMLFYVNNEEDDAKLNFSLIFTGFVRDPSLDHDDIGLAYTRNL